MLFNQDEWQRYQRQINTAAFGVQGQLRLKQSKVAIIGVGGLGCPVAMYLAAAGVGQIVLIDDDVVSKSNLHRQTLFRDCDVGETKVTAAARQLRAINKHISVVEINARLSLDFDHGLVSDVDLVMDCSDNFYARDAINSYCLRNRLSWLFASVAGNRGQMCLFRPDSPCYRCLFRNPPSGSKSCNTQGIIGTVPGAMGLMQAQQGIQFLTGQTMGCDGTLCQVDFQTLVTSHFTLLIDPECHCQTGQPQHSISMSCEPASACSNELSPQHFVSSYTDSSRPLLIDARSETEHKAFNIGGIQVNHDAYVSPGLLKNHQRCFVYCQSGARSKMLATRLRETTATEVYELKGGLEQLLPFLELHGIASLEKGD